MKGLSSTLISDLFSSILTFFSKNWKINASGNSWRNILKEPSQMSHLSEKSIVWSCNYIEDKIGNWRWSDLGVHTIRRRQRKQVGCIGLLSVTHSEHILLYFDALEKCNNKNYSKTIQWSYGYVCQRVLRMIKHYFSLVILPLNQSSPYDLISRHGVAVMHSGQ